MISQNSVQPSEDPVDTGRNLNVHKTFRRLPGRLLNVFCSFNLRPVTAVGIYINDSIAEALFDFPY